MKCRFCNTELKNNFVDLINSPASNSFLEEDQLNQPEIYYPLKIQVCHNCFLVQVDEYKSSSDIFDKDYIYFSSFSTSWLQHSKQYVDMISKKLSLDSKSLVTEIASNDGYLLQYFKEKNIPCIGIEPTHGTAQVAREKGIKVIEDFFSADMAKKLEKSDLILGNNVLAHVPDINDFVYSLKLSLKETGTVTMEFPHLLQLIEKNQFDTIYHEHFSYLSFTTVSQIFKQHGLITYDVDEIKTHGGSLRIYACHENNSNIKISDNVTRLTKKEQSKGLNSIQYYENFQQNVNVIKNSFLSFLLEQKKNNKTIAAYGAAAKGNTLLNYCGIKTDIIDFVVDKSPYKKDRYLPGSHIPVVDEIMIREVKPDFIIILPWNIKDEVTQQLEYVKEWDCKFITAIPELKVF